MRFITLLGLCFLFCTSFLFGDIQLFKETSRELSIHYKLSDFQISSSNNFSAINTGKGYTHSGEKGSPDLPYYSFKVIVPPRGNVTYSVSNQKSEKISLVQDIIPIPDYKRNKKNGDFIYEAKNELYAKRGYEQIRISPVKSYRGYDYVNVDILPFNYDNNKKELNVTRELNLKVNITGDVDYRSKSQSGTQDDYEAIFVNYKSGKNWVPDRDMTINYVPFGKSNYWYKIDVVKDGMLALTWNQLSALPAGTSLNDIRIFGTGSYAMNNTYTSSGNPVEEIPILITGNNDNVLDSGDKIIFYAQSRDGTGKNPYDTRGYINPYSGIGVYWLCIGGDFSTPVKRINAGTAVSNPLLSRTSHPDRLHIESNNERFFLNGMTWYQDYLSGSTTANYNYPITLEKLDTTQPQKMKFSLRGDNVFNFNIDYYVNGFPLLDTLQVYIANDYEVSKATNRFREGTNNTYLKVYRTGSSALYLDYLEVEYYKNLIKETGKQYRVNVDSGTNTQATKYVFTAPISSQVNNLRVFGINSFNEAYTITPTLTGVGFTFDVFNNSINSKYIAAEENDYYSPSGFSQVETEDLTTFSAPVECVIISADEYYEYALQLAAMHQNDYKYKVVKQSSVFNQFNSGMADPNAIRKYLQYLYFNQADSMFKSVTFFGVGTDDWRNFSGAADYKNKVMVFSISSNTSDDFYCFMTNDDLPDIASGRMPVKSVEECNIALTKTSKYMNEQQIGWWKNKILYVADDNIHSGSETDTQHTTNVETTYQYVTKAVYSDKLFAIDYPLDEFRNKPEARNRIVNAVNEGRLVWFYTGHGAHNSMGDEDYFNTPEDLPYLRNMEHLPIFMAASCDVGMFDHYAFTSSAEDIFLYSQGGSVISIAALRPTFGPENRELFMDFLKGITETTDNNGNPLYVGKALQKAKVLNSGSISNNRFYTVLGDPMLSAVSPKRSVSYEFQTDIDTIQAREKVTFTGSFGASNINNPTSITVYDSDVPFSRTFVNTTVNGTYCGKIIFKGESSTHSGVYNGGFITPDDIYGGSTGKIISYSITDDNKRHFVNFKQSLKIQGHSMIVDNPDTCSVNLYLNNTKFRNGDLVDSSPTLYAALSDSNGINVLGQSGHKIIAIIDNNASLLDLTDYFAYDLDSYTAGKVKYEMSNLSSGNHSIQIIVFDNFNQYATKKITFIVKETSALAITNLLPYPCPMKKDGYLTFNVTDDAEITINIFTITGKKIRSLKQSAQAGYNQIYWDGRDQDGDTLANNTYFYIVKGKNPITGSTTEERGKLVVYK